MSNLTYKEAWDELKTRLADAETSLLVLRNRGGCPPLKRSAMMPSWKVCASPGSTSGR